MERYLNERIISAGEMGLQFLREGMEYKDKKDFSSASRSYAIAWGFNSYQEDTELMKMCDKLIMSCGVDKKDLLCFHDFGREAVNYCFNLENLVNILSGKPLEERFNPPKGIF